MAGGEVCVLRWSGGEAAPLLVRDHSACLEQVHDGLFDGEWFGVGRNATSGRGWRCVGRSGWGRCRRRRHDGHDVDANRSAVEGLQGVFDGRELVGDALMDDRGVRPKGDAHVRKVYG